MKKGCCTQRAAPFFYNSGTTTLAHTADSGITKAHGRDHVGDGEIFQLEHAEPSGQEQGASAGFEISDHVRSTEGQQGIGQEEQAQENHQLGQSDETDDDPQFAGKERRSGQVHDGLGDKDAVVPGHAGHHAAIDARPAGTEQDDDGDQPAFIFLSGNQAVPRRSGEHSADQFLQVPGSLDDPVPQADPQAYDGAGDYGEYHRWQVLHESNGDDSHQKSAGTKHRGQFFLKIFRKPRPQEIP